jgi:hypothetical protein
MPVRHRRSSLSRRGSLARRGTWANAQNYGGATIAAGVVLRVDTLASLDAPGVGLTGSTVTRTLARLYVSGTAGDTQPGIVWGLIRYDRSILASTPDPSTDFYSPWGWHAYAAPSLLGPVSNASTALFYADHADVHSQRKLPAMNDSWILVVTNVGSASVKVSYEVRTFLKLP